LVLLPAVVPAAVPEVLPEDVPAAPPEVVPAAPPVAVPCVPVDVPPEVPLEVLPDVPPEVPVDPEVPEPPLPPCGATVVPPEPLVPEPPLPEPPEPPLPEPPACATVMLSVLLVGVLVCAEAARLKERAAAATVVNNAKRMCNLPYGPDHSSPIYRINGSVRGNVHSFIIAHTQRAQHDAGLPWWFAVRLVRQTSSFGGTRT
jgi:hypothetical protein